MYELPWHQYISYQASRNVDLDIFTSLAIAQAVGAVDFRRGTQGPDAVAANTHAMSGRKDNGNPQTCQQAYQATQNQISQDVSSGDLGKALHTIQDATAPGHAGYQPWNGGLPGPGHIAGDLLLLPSSPPIQAAIQNSTMFLQDYLTGKSINPANYLPQNPCGP